MKRILAGTVVSRSCDDLRLGLQMATSGCHYVFFEADQSRILVVGVLHDRMGYQRHLELTPALAWTGESAEAGRLSSSTARNQGTTRF